MLKGIRIVEFEALGPAPFAGMHLAELGAEVIVIHRPQTPAPGAPAANPLDRGKQSICLDLKSNGDKAIARSLIASADGLIEGMRPGVMERLGFGPEAVHAENPALVYGRMTGWGQTGPRAPLAGHDLNYLGLSGALFYAGLPPGIPAVPPTMLGDIGAGALYLCVGMLAGLINARNTGQGTVVDAAIVDGAAHMMGLLTSMGDQFSQAARGQSLLDGPHWSRCYRCSDDSHMAVQCLEPQFYAQFLELMGLAENPLFAAQLDPAQWPGQTAALAALFARQPQEHWVALFEGSDACVAPVLSPERARQDKHMAARGLWQGGPNPPAPRFDGSSPAVQPLGPRDGGRKAILFDLHQRGLL